jgi:hypothetical protein
MTRFRIPFPSVARWVLHTGLLVLILTPAGCQLAAALTYKTVGPPAVPAEYAPLPEPMLVLAENYKSPGSPFVDTTQLALFVSDELTTHQIAPVIDAGKLHDLRQKQGANYRKMSIGAIGRAVGAQQVLYLDVTEASMETIGAEMVRGTLSVSIKIVDAQTGVVRWPTGTTAGFPLTSQTPYITVSETVTEARVREAVARSMSVAVVKLLRSYKPDEEPSVPPTY